MTPPLSSRRPRKEAALLERIARAALAAARKSFPRYGHRFSPHHYELPSLAAALVLKVYLRQDYRGIAEVLRVSPVLRRALGLKGTPHYSTLAYTFQKQLAEERLQAMLEEVLSGLGLERSAVAVDSTGFQTTASSACYDTRRGKKQRRWVKLSLAGAALGAGAAFVQMMRMVRMATPWEKRDAGRGKQNEEP